MSYIVQGNLYIWNPRANENSNLLVAEYNELGDFIPRLQVRQHSAPAYSRWAVTQEESGGPYYLEIKDKDGNPWRLAVPVAEPPMPTHAMNAPIAWPADGTGCVLISASQPVRPPINDQWMMPWNTRIISCYGACVTTDYQISLDAGYYPQVGICKLVSSGNQTWNMSDKYPNG